MSPVADDAVRSSATVDDHDAPCVVTDDAGPPGAPLSPWLLPVLCLAAFLVFVQAFMVAPLIPRLAHLFATSDGNVGLAVPAYLIPYGVATLTWGPVSDRIGRRIVILGSLGAFVVLTALTATSSGVTAFVLWRIATGACASGVVPISVTLIGDLVPYHERGRALGWLFGALAGGIAVGSTAGALLESVVGWQGLFVAVAALAAVALVVAIPVIPRDTSVARTPKRKPRSAVWPGYIALLANRRGRRTYGYVAINAIVQSGVYTWMGLYLQRRFDLAPVGIGVVLLGYGLPGFMLGPMIGKLADRHGRARLVPLGMAITAVTSLGLAASVSIGVVAVLVAALSLGYDLTQPLLAGIVTDLPGSRGLATGLMAFVLFVGFGLGSLIFQGVLTWGFTTALVIFGVAAAVAAVSAVVLFRHERPGAGPWRHRLETGSVGTDPLRAGEFDATFRTDQTKRT